MMVAEGAYHRHGLEVGELLRAELGQQLLLQHLLLLLLLQALHVWNLPGLPPPCLSLAHACLSLHMHGPILVPCPCVAINGLGSAWGRPAPACACMRRGWLSCTQPCGCPQRSQHHPACPRVGVGDSLSA